MQINKSSQYASLAHFDYSVKPSCYYKNLKCDVKNGHVSHLQKSSRVVSQAKTGLFPPNCSSKEDLHL